MAIYGSDIIVDMLKALDIEYVALNPGATFRGIHDSIVNHGGNTRPELIECLHEEIAVAMAHGYAKVKGKPMAAITHNIVGLQHASMAIFNAWCDRVPVLVLGGTGPMDVSQRRPWIDWIHTALVQGNLVRDFVKWDDQPTTMTSAMESLLRAWAVAQTEPKGPVYICFDVELQEAELPHGFPLPDVERYPAPSTLYPDPSVLEKTANWLAEAAFPVIIADRMGRDGDAVKTLTELAELLSIPVLDGGDHFNFASTHPLDLTGAEADILSRADLVVGLEVDDLFGALHKVEIHTKKFVPIVSPQARIVDISLRDQLIRSWATDFQRLQPVDLSIAAQSGAALSQLLAQCQTAHQGMSAQKKRGLEERKAALEREHDELRARWRAEAEGASKQSPVSLAWLASVAWETIKGEDWMLANGTLQGWARRLWDWQKPHQFLGASGGGGLGYGLGASLGAALAHRGSGVLCIDLQADGDLLFTPQALWTAAHHEIPLLMIVDNNRAFLNTENHAAAVARHRGRPEERKVIGTTLEDPTVDFSGLARSFGIHAEGPIDNPADIKAALQRAVQEVKKGNAALVDVVTAKGG